MKREFSSGGVVFKNDASGIKWLITLSSPSEKYLNPIWRLPKGWVDDEDDKPGPIARGDKKASEKDLQEAAHREVAEEAGVKAKIIKKIGTIKLFYVNEAEKHVKFVTFYLMEWQKDLPEGFGFETSKVGWFTFEEAKEKLKFKSEKEILKKADKILNSDLQNNLL